ncbi:CopG family ribbon-helix-helix protein [Candidatus Woesearchaeota archaeon]|nr:CopG family ribbon-helix-helix protein [Candidatus Woesearchaeota archaeon]
MAIISISLNEHILEDIGRLKNELGFSGRSEVIRAGIRKLVADEKDRSKMIGIVDGVLLVVNPERYNDDISKIRHKYNKEIKTQIHNHLYTHKCLQIFVLKGEAERIKNLVRDFQSSKKTEYVKLVVS